MKIQYLCTILIVLLMLTVSMSALAVVQEKNLVGWWLFDDETDEMGNFSDIIFIGDAKIEDGQLVVETGKWARSLEYTGPDIKELTLATWVSLDNYAKTEGSALCIDKKSVDEFCSIVWAEKVDKQWMPGSSHFRRTDNFPNAVTEKETGEMVFLAITYKNEGGQYLITGYRNGESLGSIKKGAIITWTEGDTEAMWGKRHADANNGPGELNAHIEESRIYNTALTHDDIKTINKGDLPVEARGKLATKWAKIKRQ